MNEKDLSQLSELVKPSYNYYVDLLNAFGNALYEKRRKGLSLSYEEDRWLYTWEKNNCNAENDEPQIMVALLWHDRGNHVRKIVAKYNKSFDQSKEISLKDCI